MEFYEWTADQCVWACVCFSLSHVDLISKGVKVIGAVLRSLIQKKKTLVFVITLVKVRCTLFWHTFFALIEN